MALGVIASVAAVAGVALVQERLTVAPLRKNVGLLGLVVASLGFGVVLRGAALLIWGKDPLSLPSFNPGTFTLLGAHLDHQTLWIWGTTIVALAAVTVLFRYTTTGKAMRACAINPIAARLVGIRSERMSIVAFVLGGALTGLVGAMVVPLAGVSWDSGVTVGLVGFIAAAIAGLRAPGAGRARGPGARRGRDRRGGRDLLRLPRGGRLRRPARVSPRSRPDGRRRHHQAAEDGTSDAREDLVRAVARPRSRQPGRQARPAADVAGAGRRRFPLRWNEVIPVVALALTALTPFVLASNGNAMSSATLIVLSAIGAIGLGLVMGLAGQFSLGQAAFYLLSGYAVAILTTKHAWAPLPALAIGTAMAIVGGLLVGWLTLRLKGFNLAIATLAINLIMLVVVVQDDGLTGGPLGLIGVPPLTILGVDLSGPKGFFWTALFVLSLSILLARNIKRSRIGRALSAIGVDEEGGQAWGSIRSS